MLGTLLGLVVSGGVATMAFVFALIGARDAARFTGVAVPVIGVLGVLWLALALFLLSRDRRNAALRVAWSPVIAIVSLAVLSQVAFVLIAVIRGQ